jgi:hypothetical protein
MELNDFVKVFEGLGKVGGLDLIHTGTNYRAFVHFSEWECNEKAEKFKHELENDRAYRLHFNYPTIINEYKKGYWICLKNKSQKNHMTPKVRIDVSGICEHNKEEEYEEEYDEEYDEEENDEKWMDDLIETEDNGSEAWEFMMEELAKEDAEKALIQANYTRSLEVEVMQLQYNLDVQSQNAWHADNYIRRLEEEVRQLQYNLHVQSQNAWNAHNAWNDESIQLQNRANELSLINRNLSGLLQNININNAHPIADATLNNR